MVSVAMTAAMRHLGLDTPSGQERPGLELSDADVFHDVLVEAGFEDVKVEPFTVTLTWASPKEYVEWIKDVFIRLSDLIDQHAADRPAEVYGAVADAVAPHAQRDGRLAFTNTALMGTGRRPR